MKFRLSLVMGIIFSLNGNVQVKTLTEFLISEGPEKIDSTWEKDTSGFFMNSLCRLDARLVQSGENWPEASFNSEVCRVPDSLREIPPGKVGAVIPYHGADCHATFSFYYSWDEPGQKLIYHVLDHYGGCRAGGHNYLLFTHLPAPPKGYSFEVRFHRVED